MVLQGSQLNKAPRRHVERGELGGLTTGPKSQVGGHLLGESQLHQGLEAPGFGSAPALPTPSAQAPVRGFLGPREPLGHQHSGLPTTASMSPETSW